VNFSGSSEFFFANLVIFAEKLVAALLHAVGGLRVVRNSTGNLR